VPVNCPQIFVVAGNDENLFDFEITSPSGVVYDMTHSAYRQFTSTNQTVIVVDFPEPGNWSFATDVTGPIQMNALGANPPPVIKADLPAAKRSTNPTISLSFGDYADTVDVEVYRDDDNYGFDGELIAGFSVENNANVEFKWNTTGLPAGEYFIYTKADDGHNAPVFQYAPGSIWVDNHPELGTPQNVATSRFGDSIHVVWDPPTAPEVEVASVILKKLSNNETIRYGSASTDDVWLADLLHGQRYELWVTFLDANGMAGPRSTPQTIDFTDESENNAPFFTLDADSLWQFVVGESRQYQLTAVDFDGDPVTFSGTGFPHGASIQGSEFVWTPDNDSLAGYHAFDLIAVDGQQDSDTLHWGAVVYKEEELAVEVRFSKPTAYEGDNTYVTVSNPMASASDVIVSIENLDQKSQSAIVTCNRVDQFHYAAKILLSSTGESIVPVSNGDTLRVTYTYGNDIYTSMCRFDSNGQPSDVTPPRLVADMQLGWLLGDTLSLKWTVPGDDGGVGRALYYDLRYSLTPIVTEDDYLTASRYADTPYPGLADNIDSVTITLDQLDGYVQGTDIYFVMKSEDEMMNRSGMGNLLDVATCVCPKQADYDDDGHLTILDLGWMVDIVFIGVPDIRDPNCPASRSDFDNDGFATMLDISKLVDHLFLGAPGPCNPCDPIEGSCEQ